MTTKLIQSGNTTLFSRADGAETGPAVVFSNALGTDHRVWDAVLPHLPDSLRIIRYDSRGHGRSTVTPAPYSMGQLISDAEAVCEAHAVKDAVFVGLSVGGMIAQGLATKRLDLIRALVLSNTAAKIGTPKLWDERITTIKADGLGAMADTILDRWFGRDFRGNPKVKLYRDMITATPVEGYTGTCAAISGTDFFTPTAALRLPTLGIAGSEDGSTPPDLVRETIDLIPGSKFEMMRRCGHIPCAKSPKEYAAILIRFLRGIGHI